MDICSEEGCERAAKSRGKCQSHYVNEWKRQKTARKYAGFGELTCATCGILYIPKRYHSDTGRNKFCSRKCKQQERMDSGKSSLATRKWIMFHKYGVTHEQYEAMREAQGNGCAVCGRTVPNGRAAKLGNTWLHVDHDHESGRVRGLLCMECNTGLGKFQHDVQLLRAAVDYLAK